MYNLIKSEQLKQKNTSVYKMLFLIPLICMLLGMLFMGFTYVQQSSYNWWYMTFLPFMLVYEAADLLHSEKKYNYHGLFAIVEKKENLWYAKIIIGGCYLFFANIIFFILNTIFGIPGGMKISLMDNLAAVFVLSITMFWQIPLFMYICKKTNLFITIFLGLACNIFFSSTYALTKLWWIPFAIPARLMCPVVKIFPNGLLIEKKDAMLSSGCILPGCLISIGCFVFFSIVTAQLFAKQEVKS